jgi:hypothetical protein
MFLCVCALSRECSYVSILSRAYAHEERGYVFKQRILSVVFEQRILSVKYDERVLTATLS